MKHDEHVCAEIESSLPLYVGGDLEENALAEVHRHLGACPACLERALAARAARRELVRALRLDGQGGPDLWSGVRAALVEQGVFRPVGAPLAAARAARWRWGRVAAAAAAVAAITLGFWAGARFGAGPDAVVDPGAGTPLVDAGSSGLGAPVVPVVEDDAAGGLRRLQPGEARLRDGAVPIYLQDLMNGYPLEVQPTQPAALRRVGGLPQSR